jgi:hypothetical protein
MYAPPLIGMEAANQSSALTLGNADSDTLSVANKYPIGWNLLRDTFMIESWNSGGEKGSFAPPSWEKGTRAMSRQPGSRRPGGSRRKPLSASELALAS